MKALILVLIAAFALSACGKKTPLKKPGETPDAGIVISASTAI
jgi:predicted small lipoprotein YifL